METRRSVSRPAFRVEPSASMKLIKKQISEKDGGGSVKLRAEEAEDMWHTFHIIAPGDRVRTTTLRKVTDLKRIDEDFIFRIKKCPSFV